MAITSTTVQTNARGFDLYSEDFTYSYACGLGAVKEKISLFRTRQVLERSTMLLYPDLEWPLWRATPANALRYQALAGKAGCEQVDLRECCHLKCHPGGRATFLVFVSCITCGSVFSQFSDHKTLQLSVRRNGRTGPQPSRS